MGLTILGAILGAVASWVITHGYYRFSERKAARENPLPLLDQISTELATLSHRLGTQTTDDSSLQQSICESQKQLDHVEYVFRAALQNWFSEFAALRLLLQDYQAEKVKSQIAKIDQMMTAMAGDLRERPSDTANDTSSNGSEKSGPKDLGGLERNVRG